VAVPVSGASASAIEPREPVDAVGAESLGVGSAAPPAWPDCAAPAVGPKVFAADTTGATAPVTGASALAAVLAVGASAPLASGAAVLPASREAGADAEADCAFGPLADWSPPPPGNEDEDAAVPLPEDLALPEDAPLPGAGPPAAAAD
jgi:hypothetical protein